ncbi:MAG TPA: IS1182 family transposase [Vicinamibacterales bacterium]|jgi:transposase|nr:IS1182 family transposase [Vicinamibacterales bacterium]
MDDPLFPDVDAREESDGLDDAPVRYETANRHQIELQPCDLEALLPPGHAARLVWRFVEGLDLTAFYATIRAREGRAGRSPIDPKILIALWLYATIDGVGSARELDRLCYAHDAYRWLRGGVSVNYHTLSDFRVAHHGALDDVLTQSIAVLLQRGIVTLARVAHDGTRVRGSAGAGSFRRGATLRECLRQARKQVTRTAKQTAAPLNARVEAAQRRAVGERLARVDEALAQLPAVQAIKDRQSGTRPREARVSTTDPDARVMKMADGGYRPAYNVHLATDVDSRVIVGVRTINSGNDQSQLGPMLDVIAHRLGQLPRAHLLDGGFVTKAEITAAAARSVTIYAPPMQRRGRTRAADQPVPGDSPAVAAWRARMASDEGKTIYKGRAATAEWVNADVRTHRTLGRVLVRGLAKVHTWALWVALAHNMMRMMEIVPHLMT